MYLPQEIWDRILYFIGPYHQWRIPSLRTRLTCTERQAMGLWHRIIDSDDWPEAIRRHDLDPLLYGDIQTIYDSSPLEKPYIIATLRATDLVRENIQPEKFLQSLKAKVDPSTHEADFGTFVLNVSGILDAGLPIEVSGLLGAHQHGFGFKFSQPGTWTSADVTLSGQGFSILEVQGVDLVLTEPSDAVHATRRWSGGSRTFPNLMYRRGHLFDGMFARRRGSVIRCWV